MAKKLKINDRCFRKTLKTNRAFHVLGQLTSFHAGGCWIAARAFQKVYGGTLRAIASERNSAEHVVIELAGQYFDADGAQSRDALLDKMRSVEGVPFPRIAKLPKHLRDIVTDESAANALAMIIRERC